MFLLGICKFCTPQGVTCKCNCLYVDVTGLGLETQNLFK